MRSQAQSPAPFARACSIGEMSPQLPDHVSSRAHDIIIACVVGPIVSTIIVSIRIWTRVVVTHNLGWDDYAAIVTLSACIGFSCVLGISTKYGMGLHLKDVRFIPESLFPSHCRFFSHGIVLRAEYPVQHRLSPQICFHSSIQCFDEEMLTPMFAIDDTGTQVRPF